MNHISSTDAAFLLVEHFKNIHTKDINIYSYPRDIKALKNEIQNIVDDDFKLDCSGSIFSISDVIKANPKLSACPLFIQDVLCLANSFKEITNSNTLKLHISTIKNNMCRRFHSDVNDIRLLCTYYGQGTLWLDNQNVNQSALLSGAGNDQIVINHRCINQAKTGDILLLKGALYPNMDITPIVHRSPTIEDAGEKRLLLRIDTN